MGSGGVWFVSAVAMEMVAVVVVLKVGLVGVDLVDE